MGLKDLPVQPSVMGSDLVATAYTTELKEVTTPDALKAFVERWKALYMLTRERKIDKKGKDAKRFRISFKNLKRMIVGDFNATEALECIAAGRGGACKHSSQYSCAGMHILCPLILVQMLQIADHFGVTVDIAMIQAFGGMGALDER